MSRIFKTIVRLVLVLAVVLAVVGVWQRERLTRLAATISLFDPDQIVGNFTSMDTIFLSAPLPAASAEPSELPEGPPAALPEDFDAWVDRARITGIVVLKDGQMRYEDYPLSDPDRTDDPGLRTRISWSLAKSFLSVLAGTLVEDGSIADLDDMAVTYAPDLAASAYADATVRDVLQMSSGIVFDEDYLDFWSDINKMGRVLALGRSMDDFALTQTDSFAPPGTEWKYTSIDTHVVGMILRGASGRSIPELLVERVLTPLGLERDPFYLTDGYGVAFVLGGLNLTTRDYARFGQMVANGGTFNGNRIVSEAWIDESIVASAPGGAGYGYQWWIPGSFVEGEVIGRGIYGQYLYINRNTNVVIAVNAADRGFREPGVNDANVAMLQAIAGGLD